MRRSVYHGSGPENGPEIPAASVITWHSKLTRANGQGSTVMLYDEAVKCCEALNRRWPDLVHRPSPRFRERFRDLKMDLIFSPRVPDETFRAAWGPTLGITDWGDWLLAPEPFTWLEAAEWSRLFGSKETIALSSGDTLLRRPPPIVARRRQQRRRAPG